MCLIWLNLGLKHKSLSLHFRMCTRVSADWAFVVTLYDIKATVLFYFSRKQLKTGVIFVPSIISCISIFYITVL